MKVILSILLLIITSDHIFLCECVPLSFDEEVKKSNFIFHGEVMTANDYEYDIRIIKTWKGSLSGGMIHIVQGKASCERRTFELGKDYIFYLRHEAVFNCSRTNEYRLTTDAEILDEKFITQ